MEMTVREAGARLGFCDEHVRRLMRSGELASVTVGRRRMTWAVSVEKLIRDRTAVGEQAHRLVRWLALIPDAEPVSLRELVTETFALPAEDVDAVLLAWAKKRRQSRGITAGI